MKLSARIGLLIALGASIRISSVLAQDSHPANPSASTAPSPQVPPQPQAGGDSVLRVTTRLVQMNVVVHDRHGNPVSDLTKDNFSITDQGKPQTISVFSVEALKVSAPAAVAMPANQFSNRVDRQSGHPTSVTAILLDLTNTKFADQAYAKAQVVKFLKQVRPDDRIALYTAGGNLRVIHDFTNNAESLLAALGKFVPGVSRELDASTQDPSNTGSDLLDQIVDSSNDRMANFFTRNRVINSCQTLNVIANHLAGISGRKNLIWVSSGFPISIGFGDSDQSRAFGTPARDMELFGDQIEQTSRAMNEANVAVYPVDARGLMVAPIFDASRPTPPSMTRGGMPNMRDFQVDRRNIDTMNYMADLTGGKAFYNTNDLQGAIRKAIDDSAVTYTIGYYSSDENWDNKYHKIKVKVNRGGLNVRTKKGYFAKDQTQPPPKQLEIAMMAAIWSPLDATGIGLRARLDPSPAAPNTTRVTLLVDPRDFSLKPNADRITGALEFVFVQETKKGKKLASEKQTLELNLKKATYDQIEKTGLRAGRDLQLRPDTESIRLVVLDHLTGSTGSLTMPVTPENKSSAASQNKTPSVKSPTPQGDAPGATAHHP